MSRLAVLMFPAALSCLGATVGFPTPTQAQESSYVVPVETDDGWSTAAPADVGLDTDLLTRLMRRLQGTENHIHSILIVKDGYLVFEAYFDGSDPNLLDENLRIGGPLRFEPQRFGREVLHFTASVTKSVTSLLVGIAIDQGYIDGTDTPMFSFFPDYAHLRTPAKDSITVHHMLSMTTGLPFDQSYPATDPRNESHQLFLAEDPLGFALDRDVTYPPGTTYEYNSGTTDLLGEIVRRSTGQSVSAFAEEHLFGRLGITTYRWAATAMAPDVTFASGGLYLRPRDMAKIGQLMLQDGVWNGCQVVSSEWVRRSVAMATIGPSGRDYGYGYQWRLARYGGIPAFRAVGWGGQYIVVLPELNIVFVETAGRYSSERVRIAHDRIIEQYVLPAMVRRPTQRGPW